MFLREGLLLLLCQFVHEYQENLLLLLLLFLLLGALTLDLIQE